MEQQKNESGAISELLNLYHVSNAEEMNRDLLIGILYRPHLHYFKSLLLKINICSTIL